VAAVVAVAEAVEAFVLVVGAAVSEAVTVAVSEVVAVVVVALSVQ
jgi:hypothetical protein